MKWYELIGIVVLSIILDIFVDLSIIEIILFDTCAFTLFSVWNVQQDVKDIWNIVKGTKICVNKVENGEAESAEIIIEKK